MESDTQIGGRVYSQVIFITCLLSIDTKSSSVGV